MGVGGYAATPCSDGQDVGVVVKDVVGLGLVDAMSDPIVRRITEDRVACVGNCGRAL